eukprot:g83298.t1
MHDSHFYGEKRGALLQDQPSKQLVKRPAKLGVLRWMFFLRQCKTRMTSLSSFDRKEQVKGLSSMCMRHVREMYRSGKTTPSELCSKILQKAQAGSAIDHIWTTLSTAQQVAEQTARLEALSAKERDALPLYGIPFAVKDNIDVEGFPTTNGVAKAAFLAASGGKNNKQSSSPVVARLLAAGAVCIGKTNMDQLATGLVGVRSPYGVPASAFDSRFISGGSSSGSGLAVAANLVSFSLGTDTAGSGRVPASYGNIIGVKPTLGILSATGVVPACRSLDTISIFALCVQDAAEVLHQAAAFDCHDSYARPAASVGARLKRTPGGPAPTTPTRPDHVFTCAVPRPDQLQFFGDQYQQSKVWEEGLRQLEAAGAQLLEIDYSPFAQAAKLLYEGPWVAERYAANKELMEKYPQDVHPTVRQIIAGASNPNQTAVAAFQAQYKLKELKRKSELVWTRADMLATPTVGAHYTIAEVQADPVRLNSNNGYYTNHMNLFDLCALAVPTGFTPVGKLPFGITLSAPACHDVKLLEVALLLEQLAPKQVGGGVVGEVGQNGKRDLSALNKLAALPETKTVRLAVCGAHMAGLPLNWQLAKAGARCVESTKTSASYKLVCFDKMAPPRPGLVAAQNGKAIDVEVWEVPQDTLGEFVAGVASPLSIGYVQLANGQSVQGFRCDESSAQQAGAKDISHFGGWPAYVKSLSSKI